VAAGSGRSGIRQQYAAAAGSSNSCSRRYGLRQAGSAWKLAAHLLREMADSRDSDHIRVPHTVDACDRVSGPDQCAWTMWRQLALTDTGVSATSRKTPWQDRTGVGHATYNHK